jgi:sterol desaturase/sphingolipid hydroxylase (fatty acid hydroxylase superfamily)
MTALCCLALAIPALDKAAIRTFFYSAHLGFVWEGLRDGPLDPKIIAATVFCLILQFLLGRRRRLGLQRSFVLDYGFLTLNTIIFGAVVSMAYEGTHKLYAAWVPITKLRLLAGQPFAVQAVVGLLLGDSTQYLAHWIRHKVGPLWHIHAVHHSETDLNPAAHFRNHPFDPVAASLIRYLPVTILGGSVWTGTFLFYFETLWGTFVHSDLPIGFGPLKYIFVTPPFHRIHHSIEARHWDKNFGEYLVVWDWLCGTACFDFEDSFALGVHGFPVKPVPRVTVTGIVGTWCRLIWYPVQTLAVNLLAGHPLRRVTLPRPRD